MRRIFLFLTVIACGSCISLQPATEADKRIEKVFSSPGTSQANLYSQAREWAVKTFEVNQLNIHFTDEKTGKLVLFGAHVFGLGNRLEYSLTVETKEGRYRITADMLRATGSQKTTSQTAGACGLVGPGEVKEDGYCAVPIMADYVQEYRTYLTDLIEKAGAGILSNTKRSDF